MKIMNIKLLKHLHLILFFVSIVVSFVSVLTYSSFFIKHFYISPWFVYVAYAITSFVEKVYISNKKNSNYELITKIYLISGSIVGLLYMTLKTIEVFTYTNFVFSALHINYDLLVYPMAIFFVEYLFRLNVKDVGRNLLRGLHKLLRIDTIVIPLVALILVNNVTGITSKMKDDIYFMLSNIFASNDQIYEFKLGRQFYDYTKFVNANVPENSKILIPPFPAYPWPQTGNAVYMRYFLNPRSLYSGNEYTAEKDIMNYDYVLVAWGETPTTSENHTHGWPKFDVKAEYVLFLNNDGTTNKIFGDYKYSNIKGIEKWGIIKVKR